MKASTLSLTLAASLAMLAWPCTAKAQTAAAPAEPDHAVVIGQTDETDARIYNHVRPRTPGEVPVPKFTIKTRDRAFMLTIGGYVGPIMGWDFGNNLYKTDAGINFTTQNIPVPAATGHKGDFFLNALHTALTFQVVGFGDTRNEVQAFIKIKTNGNRNPVVLNRAYISWHGLTAGEKATLIQDDNASQPPTIDPEGPCGMLSTTVYEVSYKSPSFKGFQFAVGLDMPSWYSSNGVYRGHDYVHLDGVQLTADAEKMIPDIPAWVQWGTDDFNRIRLSGILRTFSYRDLVTDKTRHMAGWGAMLSGNLNLWKPLIFYATAAYGRGIGAYLQDISGMPLSFIPKDDKPGCMEATPMMGLMAGFSYNFLPRWQFNIMGSESRIWDVRDYATAPGVDGCNYKYALYFATNVFFKVNNWMQWGVEYLWGSRHTWDMGSAHDNRVQTQLLVTL